MLRTHDLIRSKKDGIKEKIKPRHIIRSSIVSILTAPIDIALFGYSFAHGAFGPIILYLIFRIIFVAWVLYSLSKSRESLLGMVIAGPILGVLFLVLYAIIYNIVVISIS